MILNRLLVIELSQSCDMFVGGPANLLYHHVYLVAVLHVQLLWSLVLMESLSVEQKSHAVGFKLNKATGTD